MNRIELDLKTGKSKRASQRAKKAIERQNRYKPTPKRNSDKANKEYTPRHNEKVPGQPRKPRKMSASAKKKQMKALTDYAFPRAMLGVWDGITSSVFGSKMTKNMAIDRKKLYESKTYKAGNVGGQIVSYGGGYGAAGKAAGKVATKAITSKTGKRIISKAAKKRLIQSAARKTLKKAGQSTTKKAVAHAANKTARDMAKSIVKNTVSDATVGTLMNSNIARSEGKKVGSKEWQKEMALNAALDFGVGSAAELAPLLKGVGKGKKTVERIVDGKVKKVKVDKTYRDFEVERTKPKLPEPYKVKQRSSVGNLRESRPVKAGKATILKNPYRGETPSNRVVDKSVVPELKKETIDNVEYLRTHSSRKDLKKMLGEQFGKQRVVTIKNVRFADEQYKVNLNKKIVGKIVSSKPETENLAIIGRLDEIVTNGKYVGSGKYVPHGAKQKQTVRFDYFETPIRIDGKDYVARFDVEVFPDVNNYKSHDVVHDIKNIDLIPKSAAVVGPEPTATEIGKGLKYNISETGEKVNGFKDLGADTFKPSMQTANAERFGVDRGVVNSTPYGETSQAAKTMYNSDMLDDTAKKRLQEDINEGLHTKYTLTNKRALADVDDKIKKYGIEKTRNDFDSIVRDGKQTTSRDILTGYRLSEYYQSIGDYESMMEVMTDITSMESEAGRALQAMRIFSNLTPAGRVKSVARQAEKLSNATGEQIKIPPELLKTLGEATDEAAVNRAKKEIITEVWNQIPADWTAKANAWRYMCMLGNPKTHIRNMLGNALFVPIKATRNIIATGLERMLIRGDNVVRSKAILTPLDRDLVKAGAKDFDLVKDALSGSNRYFEGMRDLDARVFKNRAVEGLRKLNTNLLEKEDELFMKYAYKRAYGQFLKANKVKNIADASDDILRMARDYASKEALNSTYRDASVLADWISSGKKYANMPTNLIPGDSIAMKRLKKLGSTALEATIPFSKTPINIMRRGWDYSPGGLIQGMGKLLRAGGDNQKLMDGIAKFASGLTGTGIMGVGYMMGFNDMARGALDTDTSEGRLLAQNGEQEYSIRVGDYTYTMDWAAPISMPFFVGVQLGNEFSGKGYNFEDVLSAMKSIVDPIFNLSMLSGLNNALDTMFGGNATLESLGNIGESYVTQFIPTLSSQIAKTLTDEKRTTVSTAENADIAKGEKFLNQIKNKIPYLTDQNEPYVDMWGDTEKKKSGMDYALAAFQNFISPGTLKSTKKSEVDKELLRLGEELGEYSDIVPSETDKEKYAPKFDDEEYRMKESDLTAYLKTKGYYSKTGLQELFATKKYQNMSNEEKKKAIGKVYSEAEDQAKMEFLMSRGVSKEDYKVANMGKKQRKAYKKSGMDIDRFEELYKVAKNIDSEEGTMSTAMKLVSGGASTFNEAQAMTSKTLTEHGVRNARNLVNLGIKPKEINKIAKSADTDGSGKLKSDELVAYLEQTSYTQREKAYIFAALANWNARNPYY